MKFTETKLHGAYIIELEKKEDERGFFARSWDKKIFSEIGLNLEIVQCNISRSKFRGTIRGMHYQIPPYAEVKIVRCTKGRIQDTIIDLRKNSETFMKWFSIELNEDNHKMLYVPEGFAHGFQSLEDNVEIFYLVSEFYSPENEKGVRWDDEAFKIKWPIEQKIVSEKDQSQEPFNEKTDGLEFVKVFNHFKI